MQPAFLISPHSSSSLAKITPPKWKYSKKCIQIARQQIHIQDLQKIYKKRGTPKVTGNNLQTFFKEGKIGIEYNLNIPDCLRLLHLDINISKIINIPGQEFKAKLLPKKNTLM